MSVAVTLWWLFFFTALGLCLGSFLNVVIYRLPAGLGINRPTWSFCPRCEHPIAWYDNLPVISYLKLRGHCRHCGEPISPQYAVVEMMTAMTVVVLLDAFFIGAVRGGVHSGSDLNWRIAEHWPILLAHIILFTSLLAMSAIDIQFYWVDIRFTHFAAFCGVLLHTIWRPAVSRDWPRPSPAAAVATGACFVGFAVVWIVLQFLRTEAPADETPHESAEENPSAPDEPRASARADDHQRAHSAVVLVPMALLAFLLISTAAADLGHIWAPYAARVGGALLFFFAVILYEASHAREADIEIAEAIEAEAPAARRIALAEAALLLPGVLAAAGALWWAASDAQAADRIVSMLQWKPMHGAYQPLWGLATALNGYVIAAAIGWSIRITANLIMGKEAFATGDIHMMAAAGCVVGWQVVLLGFIMSCFLAVAGWLMLLPVKKTRAIPLGPWLWIGFLTATVFYEDLTQLRVIQNVVTACDVLFSGISQGPLFRAIP